MKKLSSLILAASTLICACNNNANKTATNATTMGISEKPFGTFNNQAVTEYTVTNANGMQVSIINYGGTVTKIITKDKAGDFGDVILGFDSIEGYTQKGNPFFGALIGRYGNRIAKGHFNLDGNEYTLAQNNNGQSLHGGLKGFDKVMWKAEKQAGDSSLKLSYVSKDGEEGYPGNLSVEVIYTLTADNGLKIEYAASTDKATPVNLTNHTYFNLSAGKDSTILDQVLLLKADKFTEVDSVLIPTGKLPDVKGTPMDFTSAKAIGKDIAAVKGGYDHNWVINRTGTGLELIASLYHTGNGRFMEVYTTEPGVQFYSGNFLDGTLTNTIGGQKYVQHAALCLETQHFPDSPNQPSFPNTILNPGEKYTHTSLYKFSVK
ncbi:MAG: aldose epimerase family protein [Ferruginibacter sp.]